MPSPIPVIDADGHVLEREQDVRKHLAEPFNKRLTPLVPRDQPWDNDLTMVHPEEYSTRMPAPGVVYRRSMSPAEQVEAWERICDYHNMEHAVCFPTGAGRVAKLREKDWQIAVARAYNDHFAKDYNARSQRVHCVGVLPLAYPEKAAAELRRAVTELGLLGFELVTAGVNLGFGDPFYDPIYAEAERLGAAICFHGTRGFSDQYGAEALSTFHEVHTYAFTAGMLLHFTSVVSQGVPVRFPNLRIAFLEIGATWLPYYLDRLDEHWEKRAELETPLLKKKPSQIVRESSMFFSIEAGESLLPEAIQYVGDDHFIYASDIPHWDNEFPKSLHEVIEHPRLSDETKEKILHRNAQTLFALPERAKAAA
jgi:predicted TIM-barrel fold metal-dependent hydrolase